MVRFVTKTLRLRRESLCELSIGDLRDVVGGASGLTCPVGECVRDLTYELGCIGSYDCPTYTC